MARTTEQLQAYLTRLEDARERLALGEQEVQIASAGGRSVTYKPSSLSLIISEIARVKRELGIGGASKAITPFF